MNETQRRNIIYFIVKKLPEHVCMKSNIDDYGIKNFKNIFADKLFK